MAAVQRLLALAALAAAVAMTADAAATRSPAQHALRRSCARMNLLERNPIADLKKGMQRQGAGTRADKIRWPSRDPADPYLRVAPGAWVFPKADPFTPEDYARDDEGDDAAYFERHARFMPTASADASAALARHYDRHIKPDSRVLDLCAGAFTQLPLEWPLEVTGLGINARELDANRRLAHRTVLNLNRPPASAEPLRLPYEDGAFDNVLLNGGAVGMLTDPVAVFAEARRVLVPGGSVIVSFGKDEPDGPKQTARWRDSNAQQRMYLCASWVHFGGGGAPEAWVDMRGYDVSPGRRPERNLWKKMAQGAKAALGEEEVVYVLQATKGAATPEEKAAEEERQKELLLSTARYQVTKLLKSFVDELDEADRDAIVTEFALYVCGHPDEKLSVMQAINPTVLSGLYLDVERKCPEMSAQDKQLLVLDMLLTDYVGDPLDVRKSFLEWMLDEVTPDMLRSFLADRKAAAEPYALV